MSVLTYFKQFSNFNLQTQTTKNNINVFMTVYKFLFFVFKVNYFDFFKLYAVIFKFNFKNLSIFNIVFASLTSIPGPSLSFISYRSSIPSLYIRSSKFVLETQTKIFKQTFKSTTGIFSKIVTLFSIRYSPTTISKYLSTSFLSSLDILYLRKNKIFNKGRYSRNRQFYRTGVYWCLYVNIIAILGLNFWFYRFTINFGYLWWLFFISLGSFIIAKSLNYNLINPYNLIVSITLDFYFFISILLNAVYNTYNYVLSTISSSFFKDTLLVSTLIHKYSTSTVWIFNIIYSLVSKADTFSIFLHNYSK